MGTTAPWWFAGCQAHLARPPRAAPPPPASPAQPSATTAARTDRRSGSQTSAQARGGPQCSTVWSSIPGTTSQRGRDAASTGTPVSSRRSTSALAASTRSAPRPTAGARAATGSGPPPAGIRQSTSTAAASLGPHRLGEQRQADVDDRTSAGSGDGVEAGAGLSGHCVEVTARWEGAYRCRVSARQFELVVDEPLTHRPAAPTPGPSRPSCSLRPRRPASPCRWPTWPASAGSRLADLAVTAAGEYDGLRFGAIRIEVRSSRPRAELAALVDRAEQLSYVSNTLRGHPELEYLVAEPL